MGYVIKSLYKEYFQKSRVFLYPALGIRRGVSVTPIETYISWDDKYDLADCKLCCLYHLRDDTEFKIFEKSRLLNNPRFDTYYDVGDNKGVYVFDFDDMQNDWFSVVAGKYSKISEKHKLKIKKYIGLNSPQLPYVESFLHPERYFNIYAEIMGDKITVEMLQDVGELCSKPDMEKETLKMKIEDLKLSFK